MATYLWIGITFMFTFAQLRTDVRGHRFTDVHTLHIDISIYIYIYLLNHPPNKLFSQNPKMKTQVNKSLYNQKSIYYTNQLPTGNK